MICLSLGVLGGSASPFWLPTGLVFGLPLIWGPRILPAIFLGQLFTGWFFEDHTWWAPIGEATGNVLEGWIFCWLTQKLVSNRDVLATPRDLAAIFPGMVLGGGVNACFGVAMLLLSGNIPFDQMAQAGAVWTMGDLGGGLIVLPLLLAWWHPNWRFWTGGKIAEFVGLSALTIALSYGVFFDVVELPVYSLSFLLLPLLLIAAFRMDMGGATALNTMMVLVAIAGTDHGVGPFKSSMPVMSIALLQMFVAVLISTSLLVIAINRQRQAMTAQLRMNADELEAQVVERTTLLQGALEAVEKTSATVRSREQQFRFMLEASPIAVWIAKLDNGEVVFANPRYKDLIQAQAECELHPMDYLADRSDYTAVMAEVAQGRQVFNRMTQLQVPGSSKDARVGKGVLASYLPIEYDHHKAVLGWFYDISDRIRNEARVARVGELYRAIIRCNEAIMRTHDENALMGEICRIAVEEGHLHLAWIGVVDPQSRRVRPVAKFGSGEDYVEHIVISTDPDVPEGHGPGGIAVRENHPVVNNDYLKNPNMAPWWDQAKRYGWGSSAGFPILRQGKSYGLLSVYHADTNAFDHEIVGLLTEMSADISFALDMLDVETARREAERKNLLAIRVFEDAHDGILITDTNGLIVDVNPAFTNITGYSHDEVVGKSPNILQSGRQSRDFYQTFWTKLRTEGSWQGEIWNRRKNGELYAELMTISSLRDDKGDVTHFVGLFTDITQIKHQQHRLELMAHYDVLTNLPNRLLFADRLNQAIARAKRDGSIFAVCFVDLDGFKGVNDSMGHEAGDRLLVEVAKRIRNSLREEDTVARLGGDEFALLLAHLQSIELCEQALSRIHESIARPYLIDDRLVTISASTGVTFYPNDDSNPDTLLRHADQAMYQAKLLGRDRFQLFDAVQDQRVQSRRQELAAIEFAFEKREFELFYQPKVNMRSGKVIGAEALIRWRHPERGILAPIEFLPLIEGTEFEISLGYWVIETALTQMDLWRDQGLDLDVSVNVSAAHLQNVNFLLELSAACSRHPLLRPMQLELELLESSVLDNLLHVSEMIKAGRDSLGVKFSLDDFGTGYSSLSHMRHLSVDTIKIDQSFVRDMIDDPDDWTIVEGVVGLANAFHRNVVAEGVESIRHGIMLLSLNCEQAQGYAIAKPMPALEMVDWVQNYCGFPEWDDAGGSGQLPWEAQRLLLKLESDQWVNRVEGYLQTGPNESAVLPVLEKEKCHLGRWISYAQHQGKINSSILEQIRDTHDKMHVLGIRALQLNQDGARQEAQIVAQELRQAQSLLAEILEAQPTATLSPMADTLYDSVVI